MDNIKKMKAVLKNATDPRLIKHLKEKITILENKQIVLK